MIQGRWLRSLAALALWMLGTGQAAAQISQAPAWALKTPEGAVVRYPEDAQGAPTVLLFWPSWCPYSRALQPYVQDIWEDYRDRGVKLWTINIMERGDPVQAMKDRGLSFPLLLNGDPLVDAFGIVRTPWLVVIDGQGHIVYTRPGNASGPIEVAEHARKALNQLLGPRAVPLPKDYPPPYDLHLRNRTGDGQVFDPVPNEEWQPWAMAYLKTVAADERIPGQPARGPVKDGKTAIGIAREIWSAAYGAEPTRNQAPYRAYRQSRRWVVSGLAISGRLGEGCILVLDADSGDVIRMSCHEQ